MISCISFKEAKNYGGCMPILQTAIGGAEISFSLFQIVKTLLETTEPSRKERRFKKILSQMKIGAIRCFPIAGTVLSFASLYEKPLHIQNAEKIFNLMNNWDKPIVMGQGEYVIFSQMDNVVSILPKEIYEKAYNILLENTPRKLQKEDLDRRHSIISEKLKEIHPSLKVVFIPRTLYELTYIEQCIDEDHKCYDENSEHYQPCSISLRESTPIEKRIDLDKQSSERKECWHLEKCKDVNLPEQNKNKRLRKMAYRLNNIMVEKFKPTEKSFSLNQLLDFAEKKITYLKNHLKSSSEKLQAFGIYRDHFTDIQNPTSYFGVSEELGIGAEDNGDAEIIRKAVKLDCSPLAIHSLFIYRGTIADRGSINDTIVTKKKCISLSFGSSLFAGCAYDPGATAFKYIKKREGYALPIPFDKINDSPFFVPSDHTLLQINGSGELFHARTKTWKDYKLENLIGVYGSEEVFKKQNGEFLLSNRTKEELIEDFEAYSEEAISMK